VQELWGLFAVDSDSESSLGASDFEAQVNMLLSQEAVSSDCSTNTLEFMGQTKSNQGVQIRSLTAGYLGCCLEL
jgi:hypothetical protein